MKLGLSAVATLVVAFVASVSSATPASSKASDAPLVALDRVTPLSMASGDALIVRGAVRSSFDGTTFAPVDLFDADAGGLQLVASSAAGSSRLVATGVDGPACAAAHLASPCLVPRTADLAHARLLTVDDFARSLTGAVTMDVDTAPLPPPPPMARSTVVALTTAAGVALAALLGVAAAALARVRRRSAIGQVYAAALAARKATRADVTLAALRAQIDGLVTRAEDLERARRACTARLAQIDRVALERKRAAWAASAAPEAREPLDWLTAELAEAARLDADHSSSVAGLERVAAALRVLALRARTHRGTRARAERSDPVDVLAGEMDRRDEALAEVERAV